jgi:hypothetical protein
LGFVLVLMGCAHMSDLKTAHSEGRGTSVSYLVPVDQAWTISVGILREAGAENIDEHRDKGYMLTSTTLGAGLSMGTYIGVWIEPGESGQTKVTVVTKRKISAAVVTALTEKGFHRKFAEALGLQGSSEAGVAAADAPAAPAAEVTKDQCVDANTKAQSLRRERKFRAAREQLSLCVDVHCPAMVRDDCAQRLDELERVQPTIVFDAKDGSGRDLSEVRVTIDGKPLADKLDGAALAVDPGAHSFTFEVVGQPVVTRNLVLKEGEKLRRERIPMPGTRSPAGSMSAPAGAAPSGDTLPGYSVVNATAYGKALTAQKTAAASVRAGLLAALGDLARYFGSRPTIRGAYEDLRDHRSGGAAFIALFRGQQVNGFVSCKLGEHGAKVAVIYSRADTPPAEWRKLTSAPSGSGPSTRPQPSSAPSNASLAHSAPVGRMQEYAFPDGTGVVNVANGWRTQAPSCLHGFVIQGPADQTVSMGVAYSVVTPNSSMVQTQRQLVMQARQMGTQVPTMEMLVAPFTGPLDAMKNLFPQLSQLSLRRGGPAVAIDQITQKAVEKPSLPGGNSATMSYGITETRNGSQKHYQALATVETDPIPPDSWMMTVNEIKAPDATFEHDLATMMAMANSWKGNDKVITQKSQEGIRASNQRFEAFQQAQREKSDAFDRQNQDWQRNQLNQSRSNDDFDEMIRGYRTVEDTRTGEKKSVDLGNVDNIVDSLNQNDPGRYQQIPLRDEADPTP